MTAEFSLTCKAGALKGHVWSVVGQDVSIGRGRDNTIIVPDTGVSRRHCIVTYANDNVQLKDLGSQNGTLLNGQPVSQASIEPGDEIVVGETLFILAQESSEQPTVSDEPSSSMFLTDTDSLLLREHGEPSEFLDNPDTVLDLATISFLGRELSSAKTRDGIVQIVVRRLRRHMNPRGIYLWDLRGATSTEEVLFTKSRHETGGLADKRKGLLQSLRMDTAMGAVFEARGGRSHSMYVAVAPLRITGELIGALIVELETESVSDESRMLDFLMAFATTAAPFIHTVETLQVLRTENNLLSTARGVHGAFVGEDPKVLQLLERVDYIAESNLNVLIIGETGTGKELVAQRIHEQSPRRSQRFVPVNCAAISPELFVSELFGHEKGGFTGAVRSRTGYAELASQGTLFLDEVAELNLQNQAALLRFIETNKFFPVGSDEEKSVDVRVVAATNQPVGRLLQEQGFREDLYHRLCAAVMVIPPLRERRDDIPLLAEFFFNQALRNARRPVLGFTDDALSLLKELDWPGNARQLRNLIDQAVALAKHDKITAEDLQGQLQYESGGPSAWGDPMSQSLEDVERNHIERVYRGCGENVKSACDILGIGKTTLYEKLARYGLKSKRHAPK